MCDFTTFLSSKQADLSSCWIIYTKSDGKEAKPIIKTAETLKPHRTIDTGDEDPDEDEDSGQSWHEMLDPELQPEQPIPDNPESQEIYADHRRLAKEYLRVDTNLYYAQDFKEKFLAQMDPAERKEKEELLKKLKEKEELLELFNILKRSGQTTEDPNPLDCNIQHSNDLAPDDGWVVIDSSNQNS